MGELQNTTITIDEITEKDNRVSIKVDGSGYFSFFKEKQDGEATVAYQQMKDMELTSGMIVDIGYTTKPNPKNDKYPYKNIMSFRETSQKLGETTKGDSEPATYDQNGAKKGMAVNCGHNAWVGGKVDDWKEHAMEVYRFDPGVGDVDEFTDDIKKSDIPF